MVYQPDRDDPWRLWLPVDGKRSLFNEEMAYYLDQIEELGNRIRIRKTVDKQLCKLTDKVTEATGINGIYGFQPNRVKNEELLPYLDPPKDLAAWTQAALAEPAAGTALLAGRRAPGALPRAQGPARW